MNGLSQPGIEHAPIVVEVLVLVLGGLATLVVAIVAGFRWLRAQIRDEFENLTKSAGFRALVAEIITEASSGWNDLNNRQHEEHRAAIKGLAKRDEERAGAITRLHERVDAVWEHVGSRDKKGGA